MIFELCFYVFLKILLVVGLVSNNMTPEQKLGVWVFFFRRQFGRGHGQSDRELFAVDADTTDD